MMGVVVEPHFASCCPGNARVRPSQPTDAVSPQPTVIDLFCGAGGFSLGFKAAGCRLQAAADIDEEAGQSYKANFSRLQPAYPPDVYFGDDGDLETLDFDRLVQSGSPDILIGVPPCQG